MDEHAQKLLYERVPEFYTWNTNNKNGIEGNNKAQKRILLIQLDVYIELALYM